MEDCVKYLVVYNPLCGTASGPVKLSEGWLGNAVSKRAAAPMRLSEVVANTRWESLPRARAIGLMSTLMCNYTTTSKDMSPGYCDERKA